MILSANESFLEDFNREGLIFLSAVNIREVECYADFIGARLVFILS